MSPVVHNSNSSPRRDSARKHIQRREWLVQAEQFRLDRHRPRKTDFLPHPTRKLTRIGVLEPIQADLVEQGNGAFSPLLSRDTAHLECQLHILLDGQPGEQRKGLEHNGGMGIHACKHIIAIQHHARGGLVQAGNDAQERALAAAGRTDEGDELSLLHAQVDILHGGKPALTAPIHLIDAANFEKSRCDHALYSILITFFCQPIKPPPDQAIDHDDGEDHAERGGQ